MRKIFTLLTIMVLVAACQFPQVSDAAVIKNKYIVAERTTMYWSPTFKIPRTHTTPAQYILEIDNAGCTYDIHVCEYFFYQANEGDSIFYNRETKTFKFSR